MSWFGLDKVLLGVDLSAEQERTNQTNAQIDLLNQSLVDKGIWTQEQADLATAERIVSDVRSGVADVSGSVNTSFLEGLKSGEQNLTSGISDSIARVIKDIWKAIPWQLWVVAAIALFLWMGGMSLLRGRLARIR